MKDDVYNGYYIPGGVFRLRDALNFSELVLRRNGHWKCLVSSCLGRASMMLQHCCRAILHDEKDYPNPLTFDPERFMKKEGQQLPPDLTIAFGFGRRFVSLFESDDTRKLMNVTVSVLVVI